MHAKETNIKLVSLKEPCTACIITDNLIKEMLSKLKTQYPFLEMEFIQLEHIKEIASIEGLEVEKLPAILINNEQVTAGTLPSMQQLIHLISMEGQ